MFPETFTSSGDIELHQAEGTLFGKCKCSTESDALTCKCLIESVCSVT